MTVRGTANLASGKLETRSMRSKRGLVRRSSFQRWARRFWTRVLVVIALLISPALILVFTPEDRLVLPIAVAVLAILPAWLLDGLAGPRTGATKTSVEQKPRTLLWLITFAALMLAIHLPDAFTSYLKLEQDRACLRAAQTWVARGASESSTRAEVICDFEATRRNGRS